MKKRSFLILLAVLLCGLFMLLLTACSNETKTPNEGGPPSEEETSHVHTLIYHAATTATCGKAGNAEYWECLGCNKCFSDAEGATEIADRDSVIFAKLEHTLNAQNCCVVCGYQIGTQGLEYTLNSDGESYSLTGIGTASGSIFVASRYEGKRVTSIGKEAFQLCYSLTSITIPSSVTSIGDYAFAYCPSLTMVTFGENSRLSSIGECAFCHCESLISIMIPSSVTSIGTAAFRNCYDLTTVTFEENSLLTSISESVFLRCYTLSFITIPASVTSIGDYAFSGCSSLTSITIPACVTSISKSSFLRCDKLIEVHNLSSLNITAGSTENGWVGYFAKDVYTAIAGESKLFTDSNGYLFYDDGTNRYLMGYTGTDTVLTLPASCKGNNYEIYRFAFYYRDEITDVTIPASVTGIGILAFEECDSLTSATFEITDGWWYATSPTATSGTHICVGAYALTDTHSQYYWKRS